MKEIKLTTLFRKINFLLFLLGKLILLKNVLKVILLINKKVSSTILLKLFRQLLFGLFYRLEKMNNWKHSKT